jgi:hypothetical protein
MYCGCGIIIERPRWFHRGEKAKTVDENGPGSAEVPPRYLYPIQKADSIIYGIDDREYMDEGQFTRSAAPSPEPLKEK